MLKPSWPGFLLIGGDPAIVKVGAKVTVTGYVTGGVSSCMQGTLFEVLTAATAS